MNRRIIQYILKFISKLVLWKYKPFVIGVTGSVGKTSAKEAIFVVLNNAFPGRVRRSQKNLNTEIGLPLAIIGGVDARRNIFLWLANFWRGFFLFLLPNKYPKILVLEMGVDKPRDMDVLVGIVRPNISILTAIGTIPVHLEMFKDKAEHRAQKAKIIKALAPGGKAILNYDDEIVRDLVNIVPKNSSHIFYGFSTEADIRASNIKYSFAEGGLSTGISFKLESDGKSVPFRINKTLGHGAVYAALAAVAVGLEMGLDILNIAESLKDFRPPRGRLNLIEGIKNTIIIDDSYNAAPLSVDVALDVLGGFKDRRKIAVLGDMLELGPSTEVAHREAGIKAASIADIVFLVGDAMIFAYEEINNISPTPGVGVGLEEDSVYYFKNSEEAKLKVQKLIREGDVVLVKGSQSIRTEKIVKEIMAEPSKAKDLLVRQYGHWLKS